LGLKFQAGRTKDATDYTDKFESGFDQKSKATADCADAADRLHFLKPDPR
jgi:hypothetical protein